MTYRSQISNLRPARALLHPLWLGCLLVLAFNDHFLKTAAFLPGEVTGKLSDVVGLVVAPALFAAVIGVRSRVGLAACHLAVGFVFSAIQLSAAAADTWSTAMGLVGFPWAITRDPTDLLALPFLFLSWQVLTPAMTRSLVTTVRRSAEAGATALGLVCCVATSPAEPGEPFPDGELGFISADVYLVNPTEETHVIRVRQLAPQVQIDCAELRGNPGALLDDSLFEVFGAWTLEPGDAAPVWDHAPGERDCYAALLDGDGVAPALAFWSDGKPTVRDLFGEELLTADGGLVLDTDADGITTLTSNTPDLLFEREELAVAPEGGSCGIQSDADRLAYSLGFGGSEPRQLTAMVTGPDGCVSMTLATAPQVAAGEPGNVGYVCVPNDLIPFQVGDWIVARTTSGLHMTAVDEDGAAATPARELVAGTDDDGARVSDLQVFLVQDFGCDQAIHDACGSVARPAVMQARRPTLGGAVSVAPGERADLAGSDGSTITVQAIHALDRAVVDTNCALGPATLGPDLEFVATYRGPQ